MAVIRKTALALAVSTLFAGSAQAIIVNEAAFEGGWFNATQSGRGLLVDVIPAGGGNNVFFGAVFTYDSAGNPMWLTFQPTVPEGASVATGFEVRRFAGGTFGNTFTPPNPSTGTVVGTGTLDVRTCADVRLDIATNGAANGLPNVNFRFGRLGGASAACAYDVEFTACPAGTTAVAGVARTCELTGTIAQNVTLTNNATYVLNGKVQIGTPINGSTQTTANLTIQPGTVIKGKGGTSDYLVVNPGSKIFAEGLPSAPIVFTGPSETGGTWAGVFLAGRAPVNKAAAAGGTIAFEADANIVFGGGDVNDSSGVLRYVQIRNAGQTIAPNRELNCLTFGGVGAGTVVDHVQCHNGTDDAFEFFGGTVNASYLVATGNDDDNLDMDYGYTGRIQYVYVQPDAQVDTIDGRCVESDNTDANGNQDALPRTQPRISNLTCNGAASGPTWFEGIRLRRGSAGNYYNVVIANATDACLRFNDTSTYTASGPSTALTGTTTINGAYLACGTATKDGSGPPFTVSSWYTGQSGNGTGTREAALRARFPVAGGVLDGTSVAVPSNPLAPTGGRDHFYDTVRDKGAFSGTGGDWTVGWTFPGSL